MTLDAYQYGNQEYENNGNNQRTASTARGSA